MDVLPQEFVEALDGMLEQYSADDLRRLAKDLTAAVEKPKEYVPYPKQELIHRSRAKIVLVTGGNRCLRGDQRIVTSTGLKPVSMIRAGDLVLGYDLKSNQPRWSLSSGAFVKGYSRQYRVVHEKGEFVSDGRHLVALPEGKYEFVENLVVGQNLKFALPFRLPTTEEVCLSRLLGDAWNLTRRLLGSMDDYLSGIRLCDRQPQSMKVFFQELIRQCNGVKSFVSLVFREVCGHAKTILELKSLRSRHDRLKNLFGSLGEKFLSLVQFDSVAADQTSFEFSQRTCEGNLSVEQYLSMKAMDGIKQKSDRAKLCIVPSCNSSSTVSAIKSISIIQDEEAYWDIQVAVVDNYFTEDGVLHHNSGKSELGAREIVWRMLGTHPYKKTKVPVKVWVGANSFKQLSKVIWPKIKGYLEPRHIEKIKNNNEGYVERVVLVNGSTLDMKTYKQDTMDWESDDIDVLWCDEPPPREHFMAAQRGLVDRAGDTLITATPLREPWIHEEIALKAGKAGYDIEAFALSSYDNPHTDHAALRRFEAGLTPEERKTRIYGEFRKLIGRVFSHFEEDGVMVVDPFDIPDTWAYFEGLDPHMSKAHGVIRLAVTQKKNMVVTQATRPIGGMRELAAHVIGTRAPNTMPRISPIVDTSVQQFDNSIGMTQREQLEMHGLPVILASKKDQLIPGLERINEAFWRAKEGKEGGLYIMRNCTMLIEELKRLVWSTKKVDVPYGSDDLIDPLRYVIQHDPVMMSEGIGIVKPSYNASYIVSQSVGGKVQKSGIDSRKYSNKAFDMDLDDDDDEKPKYKVRY